MKVNVLLSSILLIYVLLMILLSYYSWKRDKLYVALSLVPVSIYSFGYAFELLSTNIEKVKFWIRIEYMGIPFIGVLWLVLVLNFTGQKDKLKKRKSILLYIIPVITIIMNYTNYLHHLFYKKIYMNNHGIFPIVEITGGLFYWINIGYTYALMFIGLIIFIISYTKAIPIIRKQILLLIIAWVIPWASDIIYMFRLLPFHLDLCPFFLSLSGIMYSFAILKFKFLKLESIAIEKVFYNVSDGVIILDSENNIVNFNNSAKNIIPELQDIKAGGKKFDELLKQYKMLQKALSNLYYNESLISIENKEQLRYYKININNVYENNSKVIGKIMILNDITENEMHRQKLSDNLNFLETLMDAIPNPIYSKDRNGTYIHCNNAFAEYLGMTKEEVIGQNAYKVFEKNLAETYDKSDENLMIKKETQIYESKLAYKDDTQHNVIFNKSVLLNEQGDVNGIVGVIIDITEQKKNREKINKLLKLKEAMLKIGYSINEISNINDLFQSILDEVINCIDERSKGSVLLLDKDNNLKIVVAKGYDIENIRTFSVKLEKYFAFFNKGENINKTVICNDIINNINMLDTTEGMKIKSSISSPIIIDNQLYGFLNIDSIHNNIFNEGDIELMEYMRDQISIAITKHKLYEETIYLSRYDKLTNVYNRSYFEQLVQDNIYNNSYEKEFCAVIFDLNGLKFVNDNYGHFAGDELIKAFSRKLSSAAKASDIIGRFGGDEFVGIFFNVDLEGLTYKFEKQLEYFKNNPINFDGNNIVCSYSYGIANFPKDGNKLRQLIKIADERMYEYKNIIKSKNI